MNSIVDPTTNFCFPNSLGGKKTVPMIAEMKPYFFPAISRTRIPSYVSPTLTLQGSTLVSDSKWRIIQKEEILSTQIVSCKKDKYESI